MNANATSYTRRRITKSNIVNKLKEYYENRVLINRVTHAFQPTDAYYIMGHGGTTSETFRVPNDCVVVVKVAEGEKFYQTSKYLPLICKIDLSILTDPLRYRADITRALGSVAIYPPGSLCPNFTYRVIDALHNKPYRVLSEFGSGVTHMGDFKKDEHKCALQRIAHDTIARFGDIKERKNSEEIKQFIANAYQYSRYPTKQIVEGIIDIFIEHKFTDINDIIDLMENLPIFNPTQEDLCKQLSGVFFNFVCRPNDLLKPMIETIHNRYITNTLKNNVQGILTLQQTTTPFHTINNIRRYPKTSEGNIRNVLQSRLGESVAFRKPGIRNMVNSTNHNNSRQIQEYKNELAQAVLESEKVDAELTETRKGLELLIMMYSDNQRDLDATKKRLEELKGKEHNQQHALEEEYARMKERVNKLASQIREFRDEINFLEAPSKKVAVLQREIAKMERRLAKGGNRRFKRTRRMKR